MNGVRMSNNRLNQSLVGAYQTRDLKENIDRGLNTVDLNYAGFNAASEDSFEKYKMKSHVNRVLLWLASKPYDYVRESFKGGVLYNLLGKLSNDTTVEEWKSTITEKFNEEFSNELSIMLMQINLDKINKKAILKMIVKDNINKLTFTVNTEVEE